MEEPENVRNRESLRLLIETVGLLALLLSLYLTRESLKLANQGIQSSNRAVAISADGLEISKQSLKLSSETLTSSQKHLEASFLPIVLVKSLEITPIDYRIQIKAVLRNPTNCPALRINLNLEGEAFNKFENDNILEEYLPAGEEMDFTYLMNFSSKTEADEFLSRMEKEELLPNESLNKSLLMFNVTYHSPSGNSYCSEYSYWKSRDILTTHRLASTSKPESK